MKSSSDIDNYVEKMRNQGITPGTAFPPLLRWLWKKGIPVVPPYNQGFWSSFGVNAILFGLLYWPTAKLVNLAFGDKPTEVGLGQVIGTAILASFFMGLIMRHKKKKLDIPDWPPDKTA